MELKGIKAIVTGGSSGFGKGIAEVLSAAGANVWITGRNREKLAAAAEEIGVKAFAADASVGKDWDRLFAEVGDVDVLVNNAGFGGRIAPLTEQDDAGIAAVIATNLTGAIMGASRAAKIMARRRRGVIVNISSVCALHAWPGWSVYTAAKAGLLKFSHALHTEMRPYGVRVLCLIPSWGQTNFNRAAGIPEASDGFIPAKDYISPSQLGKMVADLVALPDHLTVPEMVVQPMIQEIIPM
jgi:NAD(P)-dependent dehydrogenase (short-subunit alcohol dehydrogenase family)